MKRNPVVSFLVSLLISTVITSLIALLYLFCTFNLAGGETLNEIETQNLLYFIVAGFILTVAVYTAKHFIRKQLKYSAFGIILFPLVLFIATAFYFYDQSFYNVKFDRKIWNVSRLKPAEMTKTLVKEKTLIGLTRMQIKEMLGNGWGVNEDPLSNRRSIDYLIQDDWTLTITFTEDKVSDARLRRPRLGV